MNKATEVLNELKEENNFETRVDKAMNQDKLNKLQCQKCGFEGFRIIDKRSNKMICRTCGSLFKHLTEDKE